jgi:hypothetical protein
MRTLSTIERHKIYLLAYEYYKLLRPKGICYCINKAISETNYTDSLSAGVKVLPEFVSLAPRKPNEHHPFWWPENDRESRRKAFEKIIEQTKQQQL